LGRQKHTVHGFVSILGNKGQKIDFTGVILTARVEATERLAAVGLGLFGVLSRGIKSSST
jgi:hypothetical protein